MRAGWGARSAAFPVLAGHRQQPVHGADRAVLDAVVKQPGPHLGGCQVAVLPRSQHRHDSLPFDLGELLSRAAAPMGMAAVAAAGRSSPAPQQRGRLLGRGHRFETGEVLDDHGFDFGSESAPPESCSKSGCTFPAISSAVFARSSSASSRSVLRRNFSSSTRSADRPGFGFAASPSLAPAFRALRQLGGVEGVQALAAQQRASPGRVRGQGVVVVEDPGPVLGGERTPPRSSGGSCSSTAPSWARASNDAAVIVIGSTCSCLALERWWATARSQVTLMADRGTAGLPTDQVRGLNRRRRLGARSLGCRRG